MNSLNFFISISGFSGILFPVVITPDGIKQFLAWLPVLSRDVKQDMQGRQPPGDHQSVQALGLVLWFPELLDNSLSWLECQHGVFVFPLDYLSQGDHLGCVRSPA